MELIPIGRFARLTGLTVRAVRHYGELGLLEPAYIDPDTGYRYDAPDQVEDAAAIRRLRFLEHALDEIREIVEADDPSFTRARLLQHAERAGLEVSGEPREIYWTGPEDLPVEKWLTEVQFPVVRDEAKLAALA